MFTEVYAQEEFPATVLGSIYLAGPSPRDTSHPNWRSEALELLAERGFSGHVFIPLPRNGVFPKDYDAQANWEQAAMDRSDVVLFWVPRDLTTLPAFTTNVEFGQKVAGRNVVLGYPPESPKNRFLGYLAERNFVERFDTLYETIDAALRMIGDGAERHGGECEVPLYLWRTQSFASWLASQKAAGNRLDGCKVKLAFGVGPRNAFLLYWAAHVDIHVAAEGRNKSNEIVIGRPDIKHTVGYVLPEDGNWLNARILLVREFRSPATTMGGFIREVPGGSGFKPVAPEVEAAKEFTEETGIPMTPDRLRKLPPRQLAGTTASHRAHVFTTVLTEEEVMLALRLQEQGSVQGNAEETERTYVEIRTARELLADPLTDWSNLGMIFAALTASQFGGM
jgi:hypothetical protein